MPNTDVENANNLLQSFGYSLGIERFYKEASPLQQNGLLIKLLSSVYTAITAPILNETWIAGENLSGERIVYASSSTEVKYADKNSIYDCNSIIGITLHAASINDSIKCQTSGILINDAWNWTPSFPIFLGNNGLITQSPPTTGIMVELGVAISSTAIYINIKETIELV